MLQFGGSLPQTTDIYPVARKPLRIVKNALVTFPEYVWAKNAEQKLYDIFISFAFPIWRLENGHTTMEMVENPMLRVFGI